MLELSSEPCGIEAVRVRQAAYAVHNATSPGRVPLVVDAADELMHIAQAIRRARPAQAALPARPRADRPPPSQTARATARCTEKGNLHQGLVCTSPAVLGYPQN
ncbi:hypothetical protein KACC15558_20770 [Brevibacterium ammoniilyticum]|uniref:Uncharacterized protein n=1 Tax=Brevibacterium ammoniilyticum TaxID=1046555 RepID=A0ABP9U2G6_9MICO